jgi:hypothetical protein
MHESIMAEIEEEGILGGDICIGSFGLHSSLMRKFSEKASRGVIGGGLISSVEFQLAERLSGGDREMTMSLMDRFRPSNERSAVAERALVSTLPKPACKGDRILPLKDIAGVFGAPEELNKADQIPVNSKAITAGKVEVKPPVKKNGTKGSKPVTKGGKDGGKKSTLVPNRGWADETSSDDSQSSISEMFRKAPDIPTVRTTTVVPEFRPL